MSQQTVGELVYKISGDMENLKLELKNAENSINKLSDTAKSSSSSVKGLDNTIDALNKRAKELKATMNSSIIGSAQFKQASAELDKVNGQLAKTQKETTGFASNLKKILGGLGILYALNLIKQFGQASIQAFANAQQSAIQFNNAQQNVAGSTKEQIEDLNEYIKLLEEKTSVDDKTIRQASQILAQDQIKIENQKKILGGIVDIAVANSKANGGEIDAQGTAVAVGRAFATGDLGGLTRQNIVGIDEATAKTFKLGNEAERTAIMMKLLADNGKGAGEALGKSAQGDINRAKDAFEDLQVAVGKGLSVSFATLLSNVLDTSDSLDGVSKKSNTFGKVMVGLSGILGLIINSFRVLWNVFSAGFTIVGDSSVVIVSWAKDVLSNFGQVKKAIGSLGTSFKALLSGDFAEAKEALKEGFNFKPSEFTKGAMAKLAEDAEAIGNAYIKSSKLVDKSLESIVFAGKVYDENVKQVEDLTKAKDALNKKTKQVTEATEEEKKSVQTLRDKVLDLKNKTDELVQSLGEKLVDATEKFKETVKDLAVEGTKDLAGIVVKAEEDIAELKKKLAEEQSKSSADQNANEIKALNEQITQKQKILTSYAGFQSELAKEIARVQAEADANAQLALTNTDPTKQAGIDSKAQGLALQIEALKNFENLDKQVTEARKLAGDDEFKQAQINTFAKIQLATNLFIDETTKLREKQAIALQIEKSVTDFYISQTNLRQKTLDSFATSSIATMRRIGDEAKSALSALNSLRSAGAQIDAPINPVSSTAVPGASSNTSNSNTVNNNRNVNAPITVNATVNNGVDSSQIAKDLAWQLSHK